MEEAPSSAITAAGTIREGFSALSRRPFRGILLLALLVTLVLETLPQEGDSTTLVAALLLIAVTLYLQVTVVLAAGDAQPSESVDVWLKRALARRCFWRYVAISIAVMLTVLAAGVIGLVVGGFFMGGVLALAEQAVVLENKRPAEAIARSAELGRPGRGALIVVFGLLVLVPGLIVQIGALVWDLREVAGAIWPVVPVVVMILGLAGTIALTRAFLALGGTVAPDRARRSAGQGR